MFRIPNTKDLAPDELHVLTTPSVFALFAFLSIAACIILLSTSASLLARDGAQAASAQADESFADETVTAGWAVLKLVFDALTLLNSLFC
jgi:hypothetical protein